MSIMLYRSAAHPEADAARVSTIWGKEVESITVDEDEAAEMLAQGWSDNPACEGAVCEAGPTLAEALQRIEDLDALLGKAEDDLADSAELLRTAEQERDKARAALAKFDGDGDGKAGGRAKKEGKVK